MDFNPFKSVVAHYNADFRLVNLEFMGHIHSDTFKAGLCQAGELAIAHGVRSFLFDQRQYHGASYSIMQWMEESWVPITYEQTESMEQPFRIALVESHKTFGREQTLKLMARLESSGQFPDLHWASFSLLADARKYILSEAKDNGFQVA